MRSQPQTPTHRTWSGPARRHARPQRGLPESRRRQNGVNNHPAWAAARPPDQAHGPPGQRPMRHRHRLLPPHPCRLWRVCATGLHQCGTPFPFRRTPSPFAMSCIAPAHGLEALPPRQPGSTPCGPPAAGRCWAPSRRLHGPLRCPHLKCSKFVRKSTNPHQKQSVMHQSCRGYVFFGACRHTFLA